MTTSTVIFVVVAAFVIANVSSNLIPSPFAPKASEVGCVRTSTGTDYVGTQNVSSSGRPCVRWDSLVGAFREHIKQLFLTMPERSATKAQNFCRNPNTDQRGLWCFVSQLGTVQFCTVPKCATFGSTTPTTSTTATMTTSKRFRTINGRLLDQQATSQRTSLLLRSNEVDAPNWSHQQDIEQDTEFSKFSPSNDEDRSDDMQNDPPGAPLPGSLYGDENDPYQTDTGSFAEEKEKDNDNWTDDRPPSMKLSDDERRVNYRDRSSSSATINKKFVPLLLSTSSILLATLIILL